MARGVASPRAPRLMGASILGKITASTDRPRGPDVEMQLSVPEDWIQAGATLEVELPRNLACAACGGGGCDLCERSGAASLRDRRAPVERVEVRLPVPGDDATALSGFVLRLPDRGGLPKEGLDLPRGNLLLAIRPGPAPERGVTRLEAPDVPPAEIPESAADAPTARAPRPLLVAAAIAALALLVWLVLSFLAR